MLTNDEVKSAAQRVLNHLNGRGPKTSTGDIRLLANYALQSKSSFNSVSETLLAACDIVLRTQSVGSDFQSAVAAARDQAEDDAPE